MKKLLKKILAYTLIFGELFQTTGVYALTKEENVYAKLNATGDVNSISISEHLYDYKDNIIKDKTNLKDIKNINGNEKFTQNGNDLLWETNGNNIYYKGTYEKDLPISLNVKYYLDDKESNVNDILGKKGHIKIVLTYHNNSSKNMNINGHIEKMYVPYAIVTTSILNNNDNKNIKITNGKIIDNGVSSVVMAISSPGLYESLKLNELKDINEVAISYDTDCFELNAIYSVATTSLFDDNNSFMFDEINNLYKSINLLQSNMDTIVDASKKLSDGSNQMDAGITELNNHIQELTKKYQYYRNQDINTLKEELIKIIEKNINTITPALEEDITNETSKIIKENKEELESAVITYTKKNTKLVLDEEINRIVNELDLNNLIEEVINSNIYNLLKNDQEFAELSNKLKENINIELKNIINSELTKLNDSINNNMEENEREKYINYIAEKYNVTYEQALGIVGEVETDTLNQVKKNISDVNLTDEIINALNDKDYLSNLINNYISELNNKISESLNKNSQLVEYTKEIKDKILTALNKDLENEKIYLNIDVKEYISSLVDKIIDNTAHDLSSKYTEEYTSNVVRNVINNALSEENIDSSLRNTLNIYEDDINEKITVLDEKVNTLSNSLNMLNDGSKQISSGMNALSNGLEKYNNEGINKISNLVNGDVKTLQKRIDALINLSHENKTIDSIPNESKGNSKIIFMIDSISEPVEVKVETNNKAKKISFWGKIKGLFN